MNITVGKEKVNIYKGVMQGSVISPALFNIFLEPLLMELSDLFGSGQVFAYADDIAICVTSYYQLERAMNTVKSWCQKVGVPLNGKKSSVYRVSSQKMINKKNYLGVPVKTEYKYLGVWFNEFLDPMVQIIVIARKI